MIESRIDAALKKQQARSVVVKIEKRGYEMGVNFFRFVLLGAILMGGTIGCQNTYHQTSEISPAQQPLKATNRIYVAIPEDAIYKNESVPNSGRRTALAITDAFQRQTKSVTLARVTEAFPDVMIHARDREADYVAYATILKWEDHPTEWNGIRDQLVLKIDLIEVATGSIVRTTTIDARGKVLTDGEAAPQDLLATPVDKFVRTLYRVTYEPSALQKSVAPVTTR